MLNKKNIILLGIIVIFLNIGCDQATKSYARNNFYNKNTINVIGNFFIIHYAENTGCFLSLGSDIPEPYKFILLTLMPLIFIIVVTIYVFTKGSLSVLDTILLFSIIGGGISNLYDRLAYNGAVTDFLNFGIGSLRTGILNLADISITFGAIFFVISQYIKDKKEQNRDNHDQTKSQEKTPIQ